MEVITFVDFAGGGVVAADSAAFDEGFRVLSELRVSTLGMLDWGQGRAATNRGGL